MTHVNTAREQRLRWWREARFGMFIHWGLYALPAGEWKGQKAAGIGEWIMRNAKIPIEEYAALAREFNPVQFDADAWAELALQAGMKYIVITAKHHDGFCMFESPSNPYNIVKQTPFKRDPMNELAEACRRRGIRLCFYYSQAQDWYAPGGAGHWEEEVEGKGWLCYTRPAEDFQKYLDDVVKPNLRELLTQYGPIGLIWFDTPAVITKQQSESLRDLVHQLQPGCLVSGRVGHDVGDYGSLGDNQHPVGPVTEAWETPATLNDTWGYKKDDHNWKSPEQLLDLLVNCASKGVNYLLNVGPTAQGVIPQPSVELLTQVGRWLARHGEAIYGTAATPFPLDPPWGRFTRKGNTLYLIIKAWPTQAIELQGVRNNVLHGRVLGDDDAQVRVQQDGETVRLTLPSEAPDDIYSVVALELDGEVSINPIIQQQDDNPVHLPVHLAALEGEVKMKPDGVLTDWTGPNNAASWTFKIKTPGSYDVVAVSKVHRDRTELYGTPTLELRHADQTLSQVISFDSLDHAPGTKAYQSISTSLGRVRFDRAGEHSIRLTADGFDPDAERGLSLVRMELERSR